MVQPHQLVTGLSGNEIFCLSKAGLKPGQLCVGNSVVAIGLTGGIGEPGGKALLVVAGEYTCRVARVLDFDGSPDEWTQGRVDVEDRKESLAGCQVGAVEDFGQDAGIEST